MLSTLLSVLATWQGSWATAPGESARDEDRGHVVIADLDDALTLARANIGGEPRVLAVTGYRGAAVEAVALPAPAGAGPADAVDVFLARGYEPLRDEIRSAPASARVSIPAADLLLPVRFGENNIAVGTNYPEHADDAGTTRPFLFPKLVQPTRSGDEVSVRGGLLDYEVEVAVVLLEPLRQGAPQYLGLMLSNDFTDRETLMHAVDRGDIESGKGFTTGKSFPGYLPVGSLLVIPRDWRAFVRRLELRLYVNDRLRQSAPASAMVWNVEQVLSQTLSRKGVRWEHRGRDVALFDGDAIAARTLVLTGTPHGTVFSGVPASAMAGGLWRWLAGGWDKSPPTRVIEAYADAARAARAYLQPGDDVRIHVHLLGEVHNTVVP